MLEADSDLGLVFAKNLFVAREPTKPQDTVTIFDTYGKPPQLNLTDQGYEYPAIQIRVRSHDYVIGWNLANNIKNLLHGRGQETWNDSLYTCISCANGPIHLDFDDNSRARFIINFNLQRRENIE
jgi:hypothetical protein